MVEYLRACVRPSEPREQQGVLRNQRKLALNVIQFELMSRHEQHISACDVLCA